jgi:hypothetical protein
MKKFLTGIIFAIMSTYSSAGPILNAGDSALFEFDIGYEPGFYSKWVFGTGFSNYERPFDFSATSWEFFANLDGTGSYIGSRYVGTLAFGASRQFGDGTMSVKLTISEGSVFGGSTTAEVSPWIINQTSREKFSYSAVSVKRATIEAHIPATIGLFCLGLGLIGSRRTYNLYPKLMERLH